MLPPTTLELSLVQRRGDAAARLVSITDPPYSLPVLPASPGSRGVSSERRTPAPLYGSGRQSVNGGDSCSLWAPPCVNGEFLPLYSCLTPT